jgi:hypothetical protein
MRRARGALLRLVRRRRSALALGLILLAPAVWIQFQAADEWWAEGLSLVFGATGLAICWSALVGARPDWIE